MNINYWFNTINRFIHSLYWQEKDWRESWDRSYIQREQNIRWRQCWWSRKKKAR